MAKRRNAPALFELLRESNSTRTGQVGNEDMRSQIGAGVVKNTAPRPAGHPAVVAKAKATEQEAKQDAIKAEQAAAQDKASAKLEPNGTADSVVEPKHSDALGIEMDSLMSMPEFKAGKPVAPKPEAEATQEPEPEPEPKPEPAPILEPVATTEQPKLKSAVVKPKGAPKHKRTPKAQAKPPVVLATSKVDVTTEADTKASPVSRPVESKPLVAQPVSRADEPFEMNDTEQPDPKAAGQQVKVNGNQIELTPVRLGIFGAFILLLFFAVFVIGNWTGRSELQKELEPQLREDADSTLQNFGEGATGQDDRPIDPLQIVSDMEFVTPSAVTQPSTTPQQTPQDEPDQGIPEQVLNEDSRVAGSNYLHLAALADSEEARRLQIFLSENGIKSYIRVGPRGGRTVHEIITLVGIPSEGWSTSTQKLSHVREIRRLGGIWFNEHGGSIDYSRANQSQWYKKPPQ